MKLFTPEGLGGGGRLLRVRVEKAELGCQREGEPWMKKGLSVPWGAEPP